MMVTVRDLVAALRALDAPDLPVVVFDPEFGYWFQVDGPVVVDHGGRLVVELGADYSVEGIR